MACAGRYSTGTHRLSISIVRSERKYKTGGCRFYSWEGSLKNLHPNNVGTGNECNWDLYAKLSHKQGRAASTSPHSPLRKKETQPRRGNRLAAGPLRASLIS